VQKTRTIKPQIDEGRLQPGHHARHHAQEELAHKSRSLVASEVEGFGSPPLEKGHAGKFAPDI